MRIVNDNIKNALKQPTTQRKGRILVDGNYYEVFNVEYYADAYNEGNVVGNAIASQLDFDLPYMQKFDTFKYFDGVWTGTDYEYVDMGTFTVFDEQDEDEFNKHITAFDNLIKFNVPFVDDGDYPKTIFEELQNICNQAGVTLVNTYITNGGFEIENNQFVNNESLKSVLKAICQISGTYATIKNDELVLQLKNDTNEVVNKSQHAPITWKRRTYPINQVILGLEDVVGEYVIRQDEEDIAINGVHKLVINDNPFAYTQEKRDMLIDELFNQVKGFGYVPYELQGEWLNYMEVGDTINIDGIDTILLRISGKSPKSLESEMSAPAIIDSAIEYSDNTASIKNLIKRAEIVVDKQNQTIQSITETTDQITNSLGDVYTKTEINELIQNTENGLTNNFIQSGGNNIFRNTGLWFENTGEEAQENPYEFWVGKAVKLTNFEATSRASILLQEGIFEQDEEVGNGIYTVSFTYKKLLELANTKVIINDTEYELTELRDTEFYTGRKNENGEYITSQLEVNANHITIKFVSDTDNALELWDLMVNKGNEKVIWTQNQNETTTDTVNISKGITITSSDSEVQFKANSDGIRTLDKNGNVLTDFTDKGMTTKEATVENEANIVGILRQRVGDQIWDSFIG